MIRPSLPLLALSLALASSILAAAPDPRHQAVLDLRPAGYWPADDAEGVTLHDRSPLANHGRIHHVPWAGDMLDFTAAYQWLEIPSVPAYQTPAFSLGGWFYARTPFEGGGWPQTNGMLFFGNADWQARFGIQLCIRKQQVVEVASHGQPDVVATRRWDPATRRNRGEPILPTARWHHLLYTFEPSPAAARPPASPDLARLARTTVTATTLRLDFPAEQTLNLLRLQPTPGSAPLPAGRFDFSDGTTMRVGPLAADWKVLFLDKTITWLSLTLDSPLAPGASLPVLSAHKEPVQIYAEEGVMPAPSSGSPFIGRGSLYLDGQLIATRENVPYLPAKRPLHIGPDAVWWHQIERKSGSLDGSVRHLVWFDRVLAPAEVARLHTATTPELTPAPSNVATATPDPSPLPPAATPEQRTALLALLAEPTPAPRPAALAALALAQARATEAIPTLVAALEADLARHGTQLPRVENLLRNALLRALLDLDRDSPSTRALLGRALAQPLLATYDLSSPDLAKVRAAHAEGRFLDAYDLLFQPRPLPPARSFFTEREPGTGDYTPLARAEGYTYQVNQGVAWKGGERLSPADYAAIAARHPGALDWRPATHPHLYRIPLVKIHPDGRTETTYLGGPDFVIDGEDAKNLGWTLFLDAQGYIHLFGGQHNRPKPADYMPGTWEAMRLPRDASHPDFPAQMYWVSRRPRDLTAFDFAGRRSDPRRIPATYLNYMSITQDFARNTYLYGRTDALGWQSWGAYRYDDTTQRWTALGGDPYHLLTDAFAAHPAWRDYLHDPIRGKIPAAPTGLRVLAWAWQPPFYNFCRDSWGLRFDRTHRLHARLRINGLDLDGRVQPSAVYAYSDDGGTTFHRADGTPVQLPLTLNPAPAYESDLRSDANALWWPTWLSLVSPQPPSAAR